MAARLIDCFNRSQEDANLDPLLRAGISHFWFITIHPMEDGNGRLARLLTDLALAQAEHEPIRYVMSVAILGWSGFSTLWLPAYARCWPISNKRCKKSGSGNRLTKPS